MGNITDSKQFIRWENVADDLISVLLEWDFFPSVLCLLLRQLTVYLCLSSPSVSL